MANKIAVIAAHPDDEVLGCGGTIARHVDEGDEVHVLIAAEGVTSRDAVRSRRSRSPELAALTRSARRANDILGSTSVTFSGLPDNRLDTVPLLDLVKNVERFLERHRPNQVFTHHAGDVNIDHVRLHQAVVTACRPLPGQCVKTLLFFEVASSTEWQTPGSAACFAPNWFVDISKTLSRKMEALRAYKTEMRAWPHPRSFEALEHLAHWRGASAGFSAAESFILGRKLQ